jgi:diguanylate cyclase (GGDEF)-like protein
MRPEAPDPDQGGSLPEDAHKTISHLKQTITSLVERCARDPLTGAYNRMGCEERLAEDVARASRGGGMLTLAVLDTDNLKEVNDRWGHQAGDAYLKHLFDALERNIREGDWIARWGGDEYVVAFWELERSSDAEAILRRVAEDLARNPFRLDNGEEVSGSFRAGVCTHRGDGEGPKEMFSRADAALIKAKKGGIVLAP